MSLHTILSYCKSHIYELHAILAGGITFLLMFLIKKPIKKITSDYVKGKSLKSEKWKLNGRKYLKRINSIVIIVTVMLAYAIFGIISAISPLIHYSAITAFLSAVFALDFYALFDQIWGGQKHEQ